MQLGMIGHGAIGRALTAAWPAVELATALVRSRPGRAADHS
jgi:hypothetical protein